MLENSFDIIQDILKNDESMSDVIDFKKMSINLYPAHREILNIEFTVLYNVYNDGKKIAKSSTCFPRDIFFDKKEFFYSMYYRLLKELEIVIRKDIFSINR